MSESIRTGLYDVEGVVRQAEAKNLHTEYNQLGFGSPATLVETADASVELIKSGNHNTSVIGEATIKESQGEYSARMDDIDNGNEDYQFIVDSVQVSRPDGKGGTYEARINDPRAAELVMKRAARKVGAAVLGHDDSKAA